MVIAVPCNGLNRAFKVPGTNNVQCTVMLESCKYCQRWIIPRSSSYRYGVDEYEYIDGLERERRYYSALAMEYRLPCTSPWIYSVCCLCWISKAAFIHRESKRLMVDLHCICTTIWHALQMRAIYTCYHFQISTRQTAWSYSSLPTRLMLIPKRLLGVMSD